MIIAFISDLHVGAAYAITGKRQHFGDYEHVSFDNAYSAHVTDLFYETMRNVGAYADSERQDITLVVVGDVVNGIVHSDDNVYGVGVQIADAIDVIESAVKILRARKVLFVRGTYVHDSDAVAAIARHFGTFAYSHLALKVDNCVIDIAHHGPSVSSIVTTRTNPVASYVRNYCAGIALNGGVVPDVVVRAHVHTPAIESVFLDDAGKRKVIGIVTPSWCGMTQYARARTRSLPRVMHGAIVYNTVTGEVVPFLESIEIRSEVSL